MSEKPILLEMNGIHKSFPGVHALDGVHLDLRAGEVHALLGENGAGKSTLIKVLGGIYEKDEGDIIINGEKVEIRNVKDAEKYGVSIIHQEIVLVPEMSISDNIFLGKEEGPAYSISRSAMEKKTQELLDSFNMGLKATQMVSSLNIAEFCKIFHHIITWQRGNVTKMKNFFIFNKKKQPLLNVVALNKNYASIFCEPVGFTIL